MGAEGRVAALLAQALADPRAALVELSRIECEESLAEFTREAWHVIEPGTRLVWSWHLDVICEYVQHFFEGRIRRLIINVPPGTMKSIVFSVMGPAWMLARDPSQRMIGFSAGLDLAKRDNRRTRDIITSDWYRARWGSRVNLVRDQDTTTHFETDAKGFRMALGLGASITGRRGNKLWIDDPIDAKKAYSDVEIARVNTIVDQVIGSRLNDLATDGIGLIMQRLRTNDLTGHLLERKLGTWTLVRIPMEYDGQPGYDPVRDLGPGYAHLADPRREIGELMFPAKFPRSALAELREPLGDYGWAGQYQQQPTPLAGGILKAAGWRIWSEGRPLPKIVHAFWSWDTAFTARDVEASAYSAATCWGVWWDETDTPKGLDPLSKEPAGRHKLLLLGAWWGRVEWPELIEKARELEEAKLKHAQDAHLIEIKASGISMRQALRRRTRVRVLGYDPKADGGGDKIARAFAVQDLFAAGMVWAPERPWARQVIDLVAQFGPGAGALAKDVTDTCTQALSYLRNGWWIHHPDDDAPVIDALPLGDDDDDDQAARPARGAVYG